MLSLYERKWLRCNFFAAINRSLCEENCKFEEYDENTGDVQSSFEIKLRASLI